MRKREEARRPENAAAAGVAEIAETACERRYPAAEPIGRLAPRKPALLLHSCCGPCCAPVIEELAREYAVTVFFYNPNITDRQEYNRRKESQIRCVDAYNERPDRADEVAFLEGAYEENRFYEEIKGLEGEPEGGARCDQCFRLRLEKTAETAKLMGFDCFASALAVSPRKEYRKISEIGRDVCARYGVGFLDRDFKKKGGQQRSVLLAKQYNLYRQTYCGCEYSARNGSEHEIR